MKQLGNGNDSRDWSGDNFVDFGKILVKNFGLLCIEKRFKKKYFYPRDLLTHTGERERVGLSATCITWRVSAITLALPPEHDTITRERCNIK